jgi:hypothetical protein
VSAEAAGNLLSGTGYEPLINRLSTLLQIDPEQSDQAQSEIDSGD